MEDILRHRDADETVELRTRDDAEAVDSATLARLLKEVRNGGESQPTSYNRMHNRHNRS